MAIALDTVEVALATTRVVVVTSQEAAPAFEGIGAMVVLDPASGLAGAVLAGIAAAGAGAVAVMLGDLPALRSHELAGALAQAADHRRAMVADAENEGTTLITALQAVDHAPAFGSGSRAAHVVARYAELVVSPDSGLRRDVDTMGQLTALASRLGPRTALALATKTG